MFDYFFCLRTFFDTSTPRAWVNTIEYRKGLSSPVQGFSHNPQTGVDAVHHNAW
jgi:hypothetical protein